MPPGDLETPATKNEIMTDVIENERQDSGTSSGYILNDGTCRASNGAVQIMFSVMRVLVAARRCGSSPER